MNKESPIDRDTRRGGENEVRGSEDAARALRFQRELDRKKMREDARKSKRGRR
jgi:hypothetical protein